jgi:RHS repeat-associated protein
MALGSTGQLASSTGSVTDSYFYDSFGNVLLAGTTTNPFRFVGRLAYYYDEEIGYNYDRARSYSSLSGRFLSRDLVPDELGLFGYLYVYKNPVNQTGPSRPGDTFGSGTPIDRAKGRGIWLIEAQSSLKVSVLVSFRLIFCHEASAITFSCVGCFKNRLSGAGRTSEGLCSTFLRTRCETSRAL